MGFMKERDQSWLRGPMINPNVFGSTSATLLVLNAAIALRSAGSYWAHAAWTLVSAACVFLSYTRAAWILAVPFTLLVVFWWVLGSGRLRLGHLLLMTALLASAISFGPIAGALQFEDKLGSLFELSSGTAVDRIVIAGQGLQDWLGNPLFGTGFQTYEFLAGADQDPTIPVPGVLFVQLLQYGGTGALMCFLAFLWVLHRRAAHAVRRSAGWLSDDALLPLILALDLLVAAYQVTSAIFIAYFWFLAMLVAYLIEERLSVSPASRTLTELPEMVEAQR
jgi:O-antigen ligase